MTAAPREAMLIRPPATGRLLAVAGADLPTHLNTFGALPPHDGAQLLAEVELARLTGRGGAGFPAAVKLRAVAGAGRQRSGWSVVVANGAEGEPASGKDRHLLHSAPHLVLDGLQLAAKIVGAGQAFVYLRPDAAPAVRAALRERAGTGLDPVAVTVVEAAPGFVAGQETAVVSRLNGGPALPRFAPVRVTERGVNGRPTLVQNVETLGHLALIGRYGGAWFAEQGTADSSGTFLATVHDPAALSASARTSTTRPPGSSAGRVWEVPHGLTIGRLLAATTAGSAEPRTLQAVLIGGFHGSWLKLPAAIDAPLSKAGLAGFGGSLGAGVIMPLADTDCGLLATARIVQYLAAQSARQCGPCSFGLPHLATLMSTLADGTGGLPVVAAIRQAVGLVEGRGACNHPDGTARLVRSAMIGFEQDVVLHGHGRCLARMSDADGGLG
jgi:NADH:ubiquinone oxidoreductase subunit F (NADH-binding)